MESNISIPRDLRLVAIIFIIFGVFAAIEIVVSLLAGRLSINLCALQIPIGIGLLSLRYRSYKWAMIYLVFSLVMIPVACLLVVFSLGPFDFKIFNRAIGSAPKGAVITFAVVLMSLTLWQY